MEDVLKENSLEYHDEGKTESGYKAIGEDNEGARAYQDILGELRKIFDYLNRECFDSGVRPPIISIASARKGPKVNCWCESQPVWKKSDDILKYGEICFIADGLTRPLREICNDIAHQMVHIYNAQNGVKDFCRGGTYHNGSFKQTAEDLGFICGSSSKKKGNDEVKLPDEIFTPLLKEINQHAFNLIREEPPAPPKEPKEKKPPSAADEFDERLREMLRTLYKGSEEVPKAGDVALIAKELAEEIIQDSAPAKGPLSYDFSSKEEKPASGEDAFAYFSIEGDEEYEEDGENESSFDDSSDDISGMPLPVLPAQKGLMELRCPVCGLRVFSYDDVEITCAKCAVQFERVE